MHMSICTRMPQTIRQTQVAKNEELEYLVADVNCSLFINEVFFSFTFIL